MTFGAEDITTPADDSLNVVEWDTLGGVMLTASGAAERRVRVRIRGRMNDGSDAEGTGTEIELWINLHRARQFIADLSATVRLTEAHEA